MSILKKDFLSRQIETVVRWTCGHAGLVIAAYGLLAVASSIYAVEHLSINTDTDQLIDPELGFRQDYERFNAAFPQFQNSLLFVIDAPTPEDAEIGVDAVLGRIDRESELFSSSFAPGHGAYFDSNGLLFLDVDELEDLTLRLADAQPILASLVEDPTFRGLSSVLTLALTGDENTEVPRERLDRVLDRIAAVVEAAERGEPLALSWQNMLDEDADEGDDGSATRIVLAQPALDFSRLSPGRAALDAAHAVARDVEENHPGLRVQLTGKVALGDEEMKSVSEGATLAGVLSFLLVSVVLGLGIRSLRIVLAAIATLAVGLSLTAGFALLTVGYFNMISIAFAVLFIGLGVDFAIHYGLRYQEGINAGSSTAGALGLAGATTGPALAVAAPTTAIAFFAFTPTAYAGLGQLGIISGTGLFISLISSVTLLPALLMKWPAKPLPRGGDELSFRLTPHGPKAWRISIVGLLVGLVALPFAARLRFDTDPINLKDPETESVEVFQRLRADPDLTPYVIQLLADDRDKALSEKQTLKEVPTVDRVVILDDFVPKDQDDKLAIIGNAVPFMLSVLYGQPTAESAAEQDYASEIADLREALSSYSATGEDEADPESNAPAVRLNTALAEFRGDPAALEERLLRHFPRTIERLRAGFETTGATAEDIPEAIVDRYRNPAGVYRVEVTSTLDLTIEANLVQFVDQVIARAPMATGTPVQVVRSGRVVTNAMLEATGMATVAICIFLWLLVHRVRDIALILTPVLLAGAITSATMVAFGLPFNFANVIVLPLLIGLGVDGGIHMVMRVREAIREGAPVAHTSTPRAVLLSALTTIGSFGTLTISSHAGTRSMGLLLTIAVTITLLCTLLVLPGLVRRAYHRD